MLKIKNTKHLDTAEEIFTEFLDKFQKYAAEAAEISTGANGLTDTRKTATAIVAWSNVAKHNAKRYAARIWSVASFTSRAILARDTERR